jgi:hypothetical protein
MEKFRKLFNMWKFYKYKISIHKDKLTDFEKGQFQTLGLVLDLQDETSQLLTENYMGVFKK